MDRICELRITKQAFGPDELAGQIILHDDGTITGEPADRLAVQEVLDGKCFLDGGRRFVTRHSDPVRWFEALPLNYRGTYFRAEIVDPENDAA